MHALLRQQAAEAGLSDVYEVIGCGAQELKTRGGIAPGSIDTIITVQSLCSIPTPQVIIRELYPLLKPGGKWLMYEHVKTKYQSSFVGYWQSRWFLFFTLFLSSFRQYLFCYDHVCFVLVVIKQAKRKEKRKDANALLFNPSLSSFQQKPSISSGHTSSEAATSADQRTNGFCKRASGKTSTSSRGKAKGRTTRFLMYLDL